jgi:hypothetical protein
MADTPDLGSGPERGGGSSPLSRTTFTREREEETRIRRALVAAWRNRFGGMESRVWNQPTGINGYMRAFVRLRESPKIPSRRNGLRHAFCSYHFALHFNENLTAAQAGNSPAMIHQNYKGLTTKAETEEWFNIEPAKSANVISLDTASRKQAQ